MRNYLKRNKFKFMKVIILAGGFGTRLSEYTKTIPKPLVQINGKPILGYIIEHYAKYGFKDFFIAIGYKGSLIKKYFKKNYRNLNINVIDTGLKTMTGGRLKRLKKYINNETFMFTYGDGVSNVNLKNLIKQHKKGKKLVTLTAVRPPARFGALKIKGEKVVNFREKSKVDEGWINGGYFIINSKFLDYIRSDRTYLEREPLELVARKRLLGAYKHKGFWQCVDTKRDKDLLENYLKNNHG